MRRYAISVIRVPWEKSSEVSGDCRVPHPTHLALGDKGLRHFVGCRVGMSLYTDMPLNMRRACVTPSSSGGCLIGGDHGRGERLGGRRAPFGARTTSQKRNVSHISVNFWSTVFCGSNICDLKNIWFKLYVGFNYFLLQQNCSRLAETHTHPFCDVFLAPIGAPLARSPPASDAGAMPMVSRITPAAHIPSRFLLPLSYPTPDICIFTQWI